MSDLAKTLVALPRFRWMPEMRAVSVFDRDDVGWCHPSIVVDVWGCESLTLYGPDCDGDPGLDDDEARNWLPDLDSPATRGCLLQLVREAWGIDDLHAWRDTYTGTWWIQWGDHDDVCPACCGMTEAEALVAALREAPL